MKQILIQAFIIGLVVALMVITQGCAHGRSAEKGCLASVPVSHLVNPEKIDLDKIKEWNCE